MKALLEQYRAAEANKEVCRKAMTVVQSLVNKLCESPGTKVILHELKADYCTTEVSMLAIETLHTMGFQVTLKGNHYILE